LCGQSFSVDHTRKLPPLWIPHIDGLPFRKLANEYSFSPMEVYKIVKKEMNHLPPNEWITLKYSKRKGNILNIDGKFVKVVGYEKKIPFIYAIDYFKHDIPAGILVPGESYGAYLKLLHTLKDLGYDPKVIVSDEAPSLPSALERVFPMAKQQICLVHFLENIRILLKVRTVETYRSFFNELAPIFKRGVPLKQRLFVLEMQKEKYPDDLLIQHIVEQILDKYALLFAFEDFPNCPSTNNIIEAFNSHLNGRLKTIKGFKSFRSAERWLNAWMIRRRTKPFTDCRGQFRYLNGRCSLEEVIDEKEKFENIYMEIMEKVTDLEKKKWKKKHPK
jgi:transposase-like protein